MSGTGQLVSELFVWYRTPKWTLPSEKDKKIKTIPGV